MKQKRELFIILGFIILISLSLVFAAENQSTDKVENAYSCLKDKLGDNCGNTQNTEQSALSLLAMSFDSGIQSDCKDSLKKSEKTNCFGATPSSNCDLKSTAQAILALDNINEDIDKYNEWILSKKKSATNLDWFLEIDSNANMTTCTIKADTSNSQTFKIDSNKKISGSSSCLSPGESNYFLKINPTCYSKNFTISCDSDFITALLYKKSSGSVFYVSSLTHSSASQGLTQETIGTSCFALSSSCDYEGSLWAALALAKTGQDISDYLPYLEAMSDESNNQKYFPSTFLYMITGSDDYYSTIVEKQKSGTYWQEDSSNNRYFDTALAILSTQDSNSAETENSKSNLLETQDSTGCWHSNNIRDTSFLLYSGWPKLPASSGTTVSNCEDFGHYCVSSAECLSSDQLDNFYCSSLSSVCCNVKPVEQSCSEKQGIICGENQECTGSTASASDTGNCCLDSCQDIQTENECESYGDTCKTSCSSDETEKSYSCQNTGQVCCETPTSSTTTTSYLWVWLLGILIVLLVLAIIFRNQLKIWLFRIKSGVSFSKGPTQIKRPPMPPPGAIPQFNRPRQIIPRQIIRQPISRSMPQQQKKPENKDAAFEDTMKKLRDMSK
jgi:uncharacterized integral membrane protein